MNVEYLETCNNNNPIEKNYQSENSNLFPNEILFTNKQIVEQLNTNQSEILDFSDLEVNLQQIAENLFDQLGKICPEIEQAIDEVTNNEGAIDSEELYSRLLVIQAKEKERREQDPSYINLSEWEIIEKSEIPGILYSETIQLDVTEESELDELILQLNSLKEHSPSKVIPYSIKQQNEVTLNGKTVSREEALHQLKTSITIALKGVKFTTKQAIFLYPTIIRLAKTLGVCYTFYSNPFTASLLLAAKIGYKVAKYKRFL